MTEPDPTPDPSNWRSYVWPTAGAILALVMVVALAFAVAYIT